METSGREWCEATHILGATATATQRFSPEVAAKVRVDRLGRRPGEAMAACSWGGRPSGAVVQVLLCGQIQSRVGRASFFFSAQVLDSVWAEFAFLRKYLAKIYF